MTAPAVSNWHERYREQHHAGLHDALKSDPPRTHDQERVAHVLRTALARRHEAATHWSVRALREETDIPRARCVAISRLGIQPHRATRFKLSDPFFMEKLRELVGLYLNPPDNASVLCVDEKSQVKALERTQPLLPGLGYAESANPTWLNPDERWFGLITHRAIRSGSDICGTKH